MDKEIEAIEPDFDTGDLVSQMEARFGISASKVVDGGLYTTRELIAIFGRTKGEIHKMLHIMKEEKALDDTERKIVKALGGTHISVPAYRFIKKEEETND